MCEQQRSHRAPTATTVGYVTFRGQRCGRRLPTHTHVAQLDTIDLLSTKSHTLISQNETTRYSHMPYGPHTKKSLETPCTRTLSLTAVWEQKPHMHVPHRRQWCLRRTRLNGREQTMQPAATESGTHSWLFCTLTAG